MEAVPAFSHGEPLTHRDLESITDERHRYELVDGTLIMSPSPRPLHQRVVARVLAALTNVCPACCEVLPAPVDVWITDDTVLIPDVVVGRREAFTERALIGAPELVVEVISPSSEHIDRFLKPARLATAGCPYYWIVDPGTPSIACYALRDGAYLLAAEASGTAAVKLVEPYPLTLVPEDLVAPY
jgi:Uma2 family endonuclease